MTTRRDLDPIPLADVLPIGTKPGLVITMTVGQWDSMLSAAYAEGWILLEVDAQEQPVRAYRKVAK
jgi:hypothetical protein